MFRKPGYTKLDKSNDIPVSTIVAGFGIALLVATCAMTITFGVLWGQSQSANRKLVTCSPTYNPASCRSPQHRSLTCDSSALEAAILKPTVEYPVVVTRDSVGVVTITNGTFADIWYNIGYETSRERLFRGQTNYLAFSGQISSVVGPPGLANDVFIRKTSYSDAEYLAFFENFSELTKTQITQILAGSNQYITEVLGASQPLPAEFSVIGLPPVTYDLPNYLRAVHQGVTSFASTTAEALFGVGIAGGIEELIAAGLTMDQAINSSKDMYNPRARRDFGTLVESAPSYTEFCDGTTSENTIPAAKKRFQSRNVPKKKRDTEPMPNITMFVHMLNEIDAFRKAQGVAKPGSFGLAIGPELTSTGRPIHVSGAQQLPNAFPGGTSTFNVKNIELGIDHQYLLVSGSFLYTQGVFGYNGYKFTGSSQVTTLPGQPAMFQDPSEDIFSHTETITVRFGSPVDVDVYRSPHTGFVVEQNLMSPLYAGTKSLVFRNPDEDRLFQGMNAFQLAVFSSSPCQLRNTYAGDGMTAFTPFFHIGHDNQCNYFAIERGGWYDFGTIGSVPQGILGVPVPPVESIPRRSSVIVFNPEKKFIPCWNTPITQTNPNSLGSAQFSRVYWMELIVANYTRNGRKISPSDLQDMMIELGNSHDEKRAVGTSTPNLGTDFDYGTSSYPAMFRERFTQAVAAYPTTARTDAINMLANFDGGFIQGDLQAKTDSADISDEFMLAWHWVTNIQNALEDAAQNGVRSSIPVTGAAGINGVIASILGTTREQTPLYYDWLANIPDVDLFIVNALDAALATLGTRPWGIGVRPAAPYTHPVFGSLAGLFPGSVPLIANRPTSFLYTDLDSKMIMHSHTVNQIDESGFLAVPPTTLDPPQSRQQISYLRAIPMTHKTFED